MATGWWHGATNGTWSTTTNWYTTAAGVTNVTVVPGAADTANFSANGFPGPYDVYLNGNRSIGTVSVNATQTSALAILGGTSGVPATQTLTLGTGGITVASGAAAVSIGSTGTPKVNLPSASSYSISNASSNTLTIYNAISHTTAGTTTFSATSTGAIDVQGAIGGGAAADSVTINSSGAGGVTLSGTNTYTGNTTLTAGLLNVNSTTALGAAASTFIINGGTINNSSGSDKILSNNNPITMGGDFAFTGSSSLDFGTGAVSLSASRVITANANILKFGGIVSGVGFSITKAGSGTIDLSGVNTYSGGFTLNAGTAYVNSSTAFGTGTLTINGGTIRRTSGGSVTATNTVVIGGGFTYIQDKAVTFSGTVTMNGATTITGSAAVGTSTLTFSNAISGTGSLVTSGSLTLALTGTNTFSGSTTIAANGVVQIAAESGLGATPGVVTPAQLTLSGGQLNNTATASISANRGVTLTAATTSTLNSSAASSTFTVNSIITGSGNIIIANTSTATTTLAGANTFTGTIDVNSGNLNATNATALGPAANSSNITVANTGALTLGTAVTYNSRTITINGTNATQSGALIVANAGSNSFSGITLGSASTIRATSSGTITSTGSLVNGGFLLTAGTAASTTLTIGSVITGTGGLTVTADSTGTVALTGTSTYTGATTVTAGTLSASVIANAGANSSIGAASGASSTITLGNNTSTVGFTYSGASNASTDRVFDLANTTQATTISASGAGTLTIASNLTATGAGSKSLNFGAGSVVVNGIIPNNSVANITSIDSQGGTVTLGGSNTYTGLTKTSGGTIVFTTISNVGAGASNLGAPTTSANGTLTFSGTTGGFTYQGSGVTTSRILALTNGSAATHTLTNNGTGALVFSANMGNTNTATSTFTLSGTNSNTANEIQGIINEGSAAVSLTKSGAGYWKVSNASNSFTGAVTSSAGILEVTAAGVLGTGTKTATVNSGAQVLVSGASTIPSTVSWTLNSARLTSSGDISGGIRATATSTIQGTIAATSGAIAVSGADLTISNTTSGAVYFSPDTGRTITQSGDISATAFGNIGSGKLLISGNITSTQPLNVYSGTTTINTATSTVSSGNLFFRGSSAAINLRSSYSNGIIEFDNTGAVGSNSVTITTSQSSLAVTSAKLRLVRSAAQPLSVSFRVPFAAGLAGAVGATGLLTFEYGGTVGTIGTDSSIIVDIASGRIPYSIISDGSAFVPAYSDSTVVKAPTYGSTTGFNTQSGAATISSTGDDQNANITGSITNQSTATMSSIRLASNSADVTIGGGNTLTVPLIMDMGTGVTRTIVSGGTIAVDPANGLNGRTLTIYTNNTSGSTISSNISVNEAVTNYLVKAGSGLLNISGNFDQYGFLSIVDGDLAFTSGSTFNTYGATVNFSNPASTTNSLKIQSSGESFVAGFVGGGPNTAISLEGGDVKVGYFSTTSYAGSISRTGAQKLRLFRISMTHSGDLAVPLEFLGGTFTVDRLNGATVTGSPTLTFNGGTITVTSNSTDYAYSTTFGAASVPSGRAGITLSSAAPPTGAQVLTLASLSRSARSAVLFTHTASTTAQLVITAQAAGPIGPWAFNGSNFAYYRTSGTYAGGGTVSTASVDDPIYGTDTNFLASVGAGTTFGATTSTDNINVTGAISAQTTASVNTIRSSSSITISGAGVISTNAVLGTATMSMAGASGFIQPVSGGELVLYGQTGTLTVSTGIQDNGVTPTNVIRTGTTTVTGTKTYTGSTTFLSGTGNIASDGALGTAPGSPTANIYMSGGSLNITASVTINSNRSMVLSDGVSALTTTGTGNVTYNGVISGSGTLTLGNNGIGITLGGTNTFTGGSHIGAGTITITNPSALGSGLFTMGTGTLTFGAGGGFDISSQLAPLANLPYSFTNSSGSSITFASSFGASGSSFTKGGANDIVLSADNYFSGNVTVSAGGALVVSSSGALGYTTGTNSVTVSSTASLVLDGVNTLSFQNRQFTIAGVGTATYPGALWAKSGSPTFSNSITANTTPVIGSASTGLFTISGGVFGTANITYRADGTGGIRQTGVISGAGRTLTKSGNEKLTLAPATSNTYTGLTTISAGTIVAETESPSTVAPIPAALTVSSGARLTAPTGTLQKGRLNITGTLTLNSGIVRIGA